MDAKVVAKELLGPMDLFGAQAFCIYKTTEVVMVYEDQIFVFATF